MLRLAAHLAVLAVIAPGPSVIGYQGVVAQPSAVPKNYCADASASVGGAYVGAHCMTAVPPAFPASLVAMCFVSARDVVAFRLCNFTNQAVTPPVGVYGVRIFNP